MTFARRVDSNHADIKGDFERLGCSVFDVSRLPKFTDLVVGMLGQNVLIETKTKSGKLSPAQIELRDTWKGWRETARTTDDVVRIVGAIRQKAMACITLK